LVVSIHLTDHICTALLLPFYIASWSEQFTLRHLQLPWALENPQVGENGAGKQEVCWLGSCFADDWNLALHQMPRWHTHGSGGCDVSKPDGMDCRADTRVRKALVTCGTGQRARAAAGKVRTVSAAHRMQNEKRPGKGKMFCHRVRGAHR